MHVVNAQFIEIAGVGAVGERLHQRGWLGGEEAEQHAAAPRQVA
jgi:hypothetical protein